MGSGRKFTAETKARIALEILRGEKSVTEASRVYQIKESLLHSWKDEFLAGAKQAFKSGRRTSQAARVAELERKLEELTLHLEIAEKARRYLESLPPEDEA